jgi:hypothetical protein
MGIVSVIVIMTLLTKSLTLVSLNDQFRADICTDWHPIHRPNGREMADSITQSIRQHLTLGLPGYLNSEGQYTIHDR